MTSSLGLDAVAPKDIETLLSLGKQVTETRQEEINRAVRSVVNQKIGARYSCNKPQSDLLQ